MISHESEALYYSCGENMPLDACAQVVANRLVIYILLVQGPGCDLGSVINVEDMKIKTTYHRVDKFNHTSKSIYNSWS